MVIVQDRALDVVETENAELKAEVERLTARDEISQQIIQNMVNKIDELHVIVSESDDDHSETLQELERAYSFIYSAIQVIDGASTDGSNLVKISAVRALLIAAVTGASQAVPA